MTDTLIGPRAGAQGPPDRSGRHPRPRRSHQRRFRAGCPAALRVQGPRDRDGHGQVRSDLPEDRGDLLEHRHVSLVSASCRGDPRRPRRHSRRRRRRRAVAQRRNRRIDSIAGIHSTDWRAADRDHRHPASTLARAADVTLNCGIAKEACPMNLVPTASTTAALAMGDALAMTLLVRKGFREEQFASLHPGGKIGRRLMRVEHVMHAGDAAPVVRTTTAMPDVFHEMSQQAARHDMRGRRHRPVGGRLHRRRSAPADEPCQQRADAEGRRSHDAEPDHDRPRTCSPSKR